MEIAPAESISDDDCSGRTLSSGSLRPSSSSPPPPDASGGFVEGSSSPPPPPLLPLSSRTENDEGDEEEEDVCRICRNPGDADNPLSYPCACSGSIKFVHQDCLLQWLDHSNTRQCEVCKHRFTFSSVYSENAPAKLPLKDLVVGISKKACRIVRLLLRLAFVLSVWLLIIPFITFWMSRLTFVRSFEGAGRLFLSHMSANMILTSCLNGFVLSAGILSIFFGAAALRDYFRRLRELDGAQAVRRRPAPVDGAEDLRFDELVGMGGPPFHLVQTAIAVLASNALFLGVVIFFPFSVGRIVSYYISWFFSTSTPVLSTAVPLTGSALSLANASMKSALTASTNLPFGGYYEVLLGDAAEVVAKALKVNATEIDDVTSSGRSLSADLLKGTDFGASRLSDVATLYIGYMFILCLVFFYLWLVALIRYSRGEPLMMGGLYRFASISDGIPSLFRQFLAGLKHLMTMVKVAFLLVIELGVFPLMCGWWLDVCTVKMLGTTIAQRVEFFSVSPLASSLIHWMFGMAYELHTRVFISLLRRVLRNGVLYFLGDLADPNYNPFRGLTDDPVHKRAQRFLLLIAVYGSLIVMLVFLPVKLAMRLAPSVFPLDIFITDSNSKIPGDTFLFQNFIPFATAYFKPWNTVKAILRQWFTIACWALGLTDFLLPRPANNDGQDNGNPEPARQDRLRYAHRGGAAQQDNVLVVLRPAEEERQIHATENMDAAEESDGDDRDDSQYGFMLRIMLLLVLAWITLLVFNSALIVVPISLGRVLFNAISRLTDGFKCNDLYTFIIGCYIIWTAVAGSRYSIECLKTRRARDLLAQIWKWFGTVALVLLCIFVIPVLIGLLFELVVIIPLQVPIDESPVFILYQDWALGLVFLKFWARLVMLDEIHFIPFLDESWRMKFQRLWEDGFSRMQVLWVLREIVVPIIVKLLTALCVPYVLARGIFPVLGCPLIVNSAVYRFAWLGCLLVCLMAFCAKRLHVWITKIHNSIRDDQYLIGRRLHNFEEESRRRSA